MIPQTFIFFGIVGSGKGTQVKLLLEYLKQKDSHECVYIGTGEIFRTIPEVKEILNMGKLVSDDMTNNLVLKKFETALSSEKHAIFDGYPRTVAQSEYFEREIKAQERGGIKIIYIELSQAEAMKRNLLRGRHDDTEEGLKKRFEEYENKVIPAMNYFNGKAGYTIYTINGEQSVEAVHAEIISKLDFRP